MIKIKINHIFLQCIHNRPSEETILFFKFLNLFLVASLFIKKAVTASERPIASIRPNVIFCIIFNLLICDAISTLLFVFKTPGVSA